MIFRRFHPRLLAAISALLIIGVGALVWAQLGAPAEAGNSGAPLRQSQTGATNLVATASGVGQVSLTWTAAPGATGYFVWSVKSNGTGGKWTDAGAATSSFVLTGLETNTDYWFIVLAYQDQDAPELRIWLGFSNWVAARTLNTAMPPAPSRYSAISAGDMHTCGLKLDGSVDCFGSDGIGQSSPPDGEFLQVAAGGVHTCGIKAADGTVACWGSAAVPSGPPQIKFAQIDSGHSHTCGVVARSSDDAPHEVNCWGAPGLDRTDDWDSATQVHYVSVGDNHNCAPHVPHYSGRIRCWGSNESRQYTNQSGTVGLTAGGSHTCWLNEEDGTAGCVGKNTSGQSTPPAAGEGDIDQAAYTYSAISAGKNHTCAIEADGNSVQTVGTVRCWGSNDAGQSTPPSGVVFDKISAGSNHTCGLKVDGTVRCWGDNSYGQAPSTR